MNFVLYLLTDRTYALWCGSFRNSVSATLYFQCLRTGSQFCESASITRIFYSIEIGFQTKFPLMETICPYNGMFFIISEFWYISRQYWATRYIWYEYWTSSLTYTLHWHHNDHDDVSNHQPHGCLLNRLFRRRSKETSKLRVTGLCVGNSPGPVNSPHKGPVTQKMFPFDDVIMYIRGTRASIH